MRTISPTTIRPNPMQHIQTDAPAVKKSWAKHFNNDPKPICPAPKFGTLEGNLDVKV